MSENIELCSYCKLPKKATTASASMTQWLTTCYCDLKTASPTPQQPVYICETCGKRIAEQKKGSLTQYIFKSDTCQCDKPASLSKIIDQPKTAQTTPVEKLEEHSETELSLPNDEFPTDRYKPIEIIGKGAVGVIYKARDRLLNKIVAVKTLQSLTQEILIEFQNEAKATSKFNHPNIVQVLDFGKTDKDIPYLVLEHLTGRSLDKVLESGPLAWQNAKVVFQEICKAMTYAHENEIYHRDIKPSNIIINIDSNNQISVKVIDFGLAKIVSRLSDSKDKLGQNIGGTPNYMSPDQGLGLNFDARSDIYSFGCVMFETISGQLPIKGLTPLQTLNLHANVKPPALKEVTNNPFPEELEEVIAICLSKTPADRYQSFEELNTAISAIEYSNPDYNYDTKAPGSSTKQSLKTPIIISLLGASILSTVIIAGYFTYSNNAKDEPIAMRKPAKLEFTEETALELAMNNSQFKGEWSFKRMANNSTKAMGMAISDNDLKELKKIVNLRTLKIKTTDQFVGTGLKEIIGQPLTNLEINSSIFDDRGSNLLKEFPNLKSLNIKFADSLTDKGFDNIAMLTELKTLQLWQFKLSPNACKAIAKLKNLTRLALGQVSNITASDLVLLKDLPKLKHLQLVGNAFDDSFVSAICKFDHLDSLYLDETNISYSNIEKLLNQNQYRVLRLSLNNEITRAKLLKLRKTYPKTKFLTKDSFNRFIKL